MLFDGSRLITVVLAACFETRNRDSGDLLFIILALELRYQSKSGRDWRDPWPYRGRGSMIDLGGRSRGRT